MSDFIEKNDIDRVGLSVDSRAALDELVSDGLFKDSISGYRLAISFAVTRDVDFDQHEVNRPAGHMYLISQLDPDGVLAELVSELYPNVKGKKFRTLEKLADIGVLMLREEVLNSGSLVFWED